MNQRSTFIEEIQSVNNIHLTVPDDHQKMLLEFRRKHVVQDALRHAMMKDFSSEKSKKVLIAFAIMLNIYLIFNRTFLLVKREKTPVG